MTFTTRQPVPPAYLQSPHPATPSDRALISEAYIRGIRDHLGELAFFVRDLLAYVNTLGTGSGDMAKATYDADNDGVVDNSEALGGTAAASYPTLAGTNAFSGTCSFGGVFNFPFVTLTQVTADQTDWAPSSTTGVFFRLSTDASRTIHGIVAPSSSAVRWYWNVGSFDAVFANNSASASAANKMLLTTGADFTMTPNRGILLIYDNVTARWRGHPL